MFYIKVEIIKFQAIWSPTGRLKMTKLSGRRVLSRREIGNRVRLPRGGSRHHSVPGGTWDLGHLGIGRPMTSDIAALATNTWPLVKRQYCPRSRSWTLEQQQHWPTFFIRCKQELKWYYFDTGLWRERDSENLLVPVMWTLSWSCLAISYCKWDMVPA